MESNKRIISFLLVVAGITLYYMPFSVIYQEGSNALAQEGPRNGGPGQRDGPEGRGGGGRGLAGRGAERGRGAPPQIGRGIRAPFEQTDEENDKIMEGLQQRDPNRAKELDEIRQTNPQQFINELRRYAGPEYSILSGRRLVTIWGRRSSEFLEWLGDYVPEDANELDILGEKDPGLYTDRYEIAWRRYNRIFEQSRNNPELAEALVADLELEERQNSLTTQIRNTQDDEDKRSELISQLQEVVSLRYDIIVVKKELAYEQLLRRAEELKKEIEASLEDIETWKEEDFRKQEIESQLKYLTEPPRRLRRGPFLRPR